jgi:hypothetical protein
MVQFFVWKTIDDRPENILQYAGNFFDRAELHDVVKAAADDYKKSEAGFKYLNDLIKGKTLIE